MKTLFSIAMLLTMSAGSVTGKWTVSLPVHDGIVLDIQQDPQDSSKVTANLMIPDHGDLDLVGEFANGVLTLSSTENGYMKISLKGTLNEDGSLVGHLESQMGPMEWSAKRVSTR